MGFTDIIYLVLMYFGLVVGVWGYGIAFYFGETGAFQYGGVTPEALTESGAEIALTSDETASVSEGSWRATDLLEAGQSFEFLVKTRKGINVSYMVIREFAGGFLILGRARIETETKDIGPISIIRGDPQYQEDRFMVGKISGAPKASTYTASFWDAGPCAPPKNYFYGRPLFQGARWNASAPEQETVEVIGTEEVLGYDCFMGKIGEASLAICREIPLVAKYEGDWCTMGGEIIYTIANFSMVEN